MDYGYLYHVRVACRHDRVMTYAQKVEREKAKVKMVAPDWHNRGRLSAGQRAADIVKRAQQYSKGEITELDKARIAASKQKRDRKALRRKESACTS